MSFLCREFVFWYFSWKTNVNGIILFTSLGFQPFAHIVTLAWNTLPAFVTYRLLVTFLDSTLASESLPWGANLRSLGLCRAPTHVFFMAVPGFYGLKFPASVALGPLDCSSLEQRSSFSFVFWSCCRMECSVSGGEPKNGKPLFTWTGAHFWKVTSVSCFKVLEMFHCSKCSSQLRTGLLVVRGPGPSKLSDASFWCLLHTPDSLLSVVFFSWAFTTWCTEALRFRTGIPDSLSERTSGAYEITCPVVMRQRTSWTISIKEGPVKRASDQWQSDSILIKKWKYERSGQT